MGRPGAAAGHSHADAAFHPVAGFPGRKPLLESQRRRDRAGVHHRGYRPLPMRARIIQPGRTCFEPRGVGYLSCIFIALRGLTRNYDLVFNQYNKEFMAGAWNTSEIGAVIQNFIAEGNPYENAHVVPYPYWVDTRLVGINAGVPWKDYALWPKILKAP